MVVSSMRIVELLIKSCITISYVFANRNIFLDGSMVERTAVNRDVVGSSPTQGVKDILYEVLPENSKKRISR